MSFVLWFPCLHLVGPGAGPPGGQAHAPAHLDVLVAGHQIGQAGRDPRHESRQGRPAQDHTSAAHAEVLRGEQIPIIRPAGEYPADIFGYIFFIYSSLQDANE